MANTKTLGTALPLYIYTAQVSPVYVNIDTVNEDFVIHTPAENKSVGIVGIELVKDVAFDVIVKSGSVELTTLQFSSGGWSQAIERSIKFPTAVGQPLKLNFSEAVGKFVVYIVEFSELIVN